MVKEPSYAFSTLLSAYQKVRSVSLIIYNPSDS